jgi:hypothetical protein
VVAWRRPLQRPWLHGADQGRDVGPFVVGRVEFIEHVLAGGFDQRLGAADRQRRIAVAGAVQAVEVLKDRGGAAHLTERELR